MIAEVLSGNDGCSFAEDAIAKMISAFRDDRYSVSDTTELVEYLDGSRSDGRVHQFSPGSSYTFRQCHIAVTLEAHGLPTLKLTLRVDAGFQKKKGRITDADMTILACDVLKRVNEFGGTSPQVVMTISGSFDFEEGRIEHLVKAICANSPTRDRYIKAGRDAVTRCVVVGIDRYCDYENLSQLIVAAGGFLVPTAKTQVERVTAVARALNRPVRTVQRWDDRLSAPRGEAYRIVCGQLKDVIYPERRKTRPLNGL